VAALFPIHFGGGGHSHACGSLLEHMQGDGLSLELHVPTAVVSTRAPHVREAVPPALTRVVYRLDRSAGLATKVLEWRYRSALAGADLAYLWAATPEPFYAAVARAGLPLVVERINCHRSTAIRILEEAYRRVGLAPAHGLTPESLAEERRKLSQASWIFAPSPLVRGSLLEEGIPAERILSSSYGWSPERMLTPRRSRPADAHPIFLFVGLACVRKGAHLLLDAWAAAAPQARLAIYGRIAPEVATLSSAHLARPDVHAPGFVEGIAKVYADADVFAFPTLEEGSALVVYEAMAHGLPVLTTPMGAGEVVRDGIEGIVVDPYDRDAWVEAMRRLARDPGLRARLGAAARARAREFTWQKVGERRRAQLVAVLGGVAQRARK
jgi:glycosyltransferase involved in cell wall biosynthesis